MAERAADARRVRVPSKVMEEARSVLGLSEDVSDRALVAGALCWVAQHGDPDGLPDDSIFVAGKVSARARRLSSDTALESAAEEARRAAAASLVGAVVSMALLSGEVRDRPLEEALRTWNTVSKASDSDVDRAFSEAIGRFCPGSLAIRAADRVAMMGPTDPVEACRAAASMGAVAALCSLASLAGGVRDRPLEEALRGWNSSSTMADPERDPFVARALDRMIPGPAVRSSVRSVAVNERAERAADRALSGTGNHDRPRKVAQ